MEYIWVLLIFWGLVAFLLGLLGLLFLNWLLVKPVRYALRKARGEVDRGFLFGRKRGLPAELPLPTPVANPCRVFWMAWARLMLYRSPIFALGLWIAMDIFVPMIRNGLYASCAWPLVGDIRVKVELFKAEYGRLPAVADPYLTQTFLMVTGRNIVEMSSYIQAVASWDDRRWIARPLSPGQEHFATELKVDFKDLMGSKIRPNLVFYRAFTNDQSYAYVVGALGDGGVLPARTGYAVVEVVNPYVPAKVVATWERYQPSKGTLIQIPLLTAQEWPEVPDRKENVCWMGDVSTNGLLSADPERFQKAMDDLRKAGWKW